MNAQGPVLVGVKGMVEGETYPLEYGKSVVIGRSRECDISLQKCPRWREAESAGQAVDGLSKTVSRKHVKISYVNASSIEIEDLSSNGTFVDGHRIDRFVVADAKQKAHQIQLGAGEILRLEWR